MRPPAGVGAAWSACTRACCRPGQGEGPNDVAGPSMLRRSLRSLRRRAVPVPPGAKGSPAVVPVALGELAALSSLRIYIPQDLRTQASKQGPSRGRDGGEGGNMCVMVCGGGEGLGAQPPPDGRAIVPSTACPAGLPPTLPAGGAGAVRTQPAGGGAPLPQGHSPVGPGRRHEDPGARVCVHAHSESPPPPLAARPGPGR